VKFSRVTIAAAHDQRLDAGPLEQLAPTQLQLSLPLLPPGDYTVHWAVTSTDTHQTEGTFDFTVAAP
jgi:methionine-rich copper-binding protein CopC